MDSAEQFGGVFRREIGDDAAGANARVGLLQMRLGGNGFGEHSGGVGLGEQGLALQVARFDVVAVNDAQLTDAGTGEERSLQASERATADHGGTGGEQLFLPAFADGVVEDLPGIALAVGWVHKDDYRRSDSRIVGSWMAGPIALC